MSRLVAPGSRRRRWVVGAMVAVPVSMVALLAVEVALARRGPTLAGPPLDLGGLIGEGPGAPVAVVWLGDSTASGVGASAAATSLPWQVAAGLQPPVDLTVVARSGATVADVVDHQLPALAELDPGIVFVSVGANDVTHLTSQTDFEREYRLLVAGLAGSAEVVVLGVPDMGAIPRLAQPLRAIAGFRGRQLDEIVRVVAGDTGSAYVDIAGETGPPFRRDPERFFAADRFHPSDAGYQRWASAVLDGVGGEAMLGR